MLDISVERHYNLESFALLKQDMVQKMVKNINSADPIPGLPLIRIGSAQARNLDALWRWFF
jgi:hypothetical protein